MLNNKFLGLPLVLWLVILATALLVDIPMVLLNQTTQRRLTDLRINELNTEVQVHELMALPSLTATPTATPTLAPVLKPVTRPLTQPVVTGKVK